MTEEEVNARFQEINFAYSILSDENVKRRYDNTVGNLMAFTDKKETEHEETIFDEQRTYQEPVDLDKELEKLELIKRARQVAYDEHRDKVNRAKMEQFTRMFYQQEMHMMQHDKGKVNLKPR